MKKRGILRNKNKALCRKGLLLVFLFITFLFPTWVEGQTKKAFINNPPGINLRTRPTTKGSSIITRLLYGTQVEVLEEGQSESNSKYRYYKVRIVNGQVGWVYAGDNDDWLVDTKPNKVQVTAETQTLDVKAINADQLVWADEPLRTVVQWGHNEEIQLVGFSPNGRYLASAGDDNTIRLWETSTGRLVRLILVYDLRPSLVVLSPDGRYLASGEWDTVTKLWEVSSGKLIKTFDYRAEVISFSPDGKQLALASPDKSIRLWNILTGKLIKTFNYWTKAISFSPDGKYLALGGWKEIKIYEVSSGKPFKIIEGTDDWAQSLSFFPNGKYLASGDSRGIKIWEIPSGKLIKKLEGNAKHMGGVCLAFSPNGKYLALGSRGGDSIKVWEVESGKLIKTLVGSESIVFSPDGKYLAIKHGLLTIQLWDTSNWELIRTIGEEQNMTSSWRSSISFSPDSNYLASIGHDGIILWSIPSWKPIRTHISCGSEINFSSKTNSFGCFMGIGWASIGEISKDGTIKNKVRINSFSKFGKIYSGSFSPDGKYLAGACTDGIRLWETSSGKLIKHIESQWGLKGRHRGDVFSVDFSVDGRYLASGGWDATVRLWETSSGKFIKTFYGHKDGVLTVSFSPDGKYLVSGSKDHTIKLWEIPGGRLVQTLEGHNSYIYSLSFSPEGKSLASSGVDSTIKMWEVPRGKLIQTLEGHTQRIRGVKFSPDGKYLASVSTDSVIKLWDPKTGKLLASLYPFQDTFVTLTPEGFFSGTGDFNKYVHFVKGLTIYDFNQFYDAFYRPDLVEKKLQAEDISKESGGLRIDDAIQHPPPHVAILSPEDTSTTDQRKVAVRVRVTDSGGQIGDIRLYHNGKLVQSSSVYRLAKDTERQHPVKRVYADVEGFYRMTRGTTLRRVMLDEEDTEATEFIPQTGTVEQTYEVTLMNGENTLSAAAFNGENTVMSALETISVHADIPSHKPELFVLAIGINHFKNSSLDLTMAVKDATDFSKKVKEAASLLYDHVHVTMLRDATKPEVFHTIHIISARMNPEDVFILFVATHGIARDDLYYLFTAEFDGVKRKENTISSMELMELSKRIPALKQVLVLDTCHAGGIETVVSGLYDARISVLAKALGMHIFGSAKTFQQALDEYKENGLFTYYVLKGLEGVADADRNKEVSVMEMNPYLTRTVKEASQGRQEPLIRNFGEDFPVAKVGGR